MNKEIQIVKELKPVEDFCKITTVGLEIKEDTKIENWLKIGDGLKRMNGAMQWWIGDWLNYGEQKYGEMYAQALDKTNYEYETLAKLKQVSEKVEISNRLPILSWTHHFAIAYLEPDQQKEWLQKTVDNEWSVRELKDALKEELKPEAIPLPKGKYRVIYADPAWQFDNTGFTQSAESIYEATMSTEEIAKLSVKENTYEDSVLFLWATNAMLEDALFVMKEWGFKYKSNIVWAKDKSPGMGWFVDSRHELLLIGTKENNIHPKIKPKSWFEAKVRRHSQKPDEVYEMIEKMYDAPYLELFARNTRENWQSWGNEINEN